MTVLFAPVTVDAFTHIVINLAATQRVSPRVAAPNLRGTIGWIITARREDSPVGQLGMQAAVDWVLDRLTESGIITDWGGTKNSSQVRDDRFGYVELLGPGPAYDKAIARLILKGFLLHDHRNTLAPLERDDKRLLGKVLNRPARPAPRTDKEGPRP